MNKLTRGALPALFVLSGCSQATREALVKGALAAENARRARQEQVGNILEAKMPTSSTGQQGVAANHDLYRSNDQAEIANATNYTYPQVDMTRHVNFYRYRQDFVSSNSYFKFLINKLSVTHGVYFEQLKSEFLLEIGINLDKLPNSQNERTDTLFNDTKSFANWLANKYGYVLAYNPNNLQDIHMNLLPTDNPKVAQLTLTR